MPNTVLVEASSVTLPVVSPPMTAASLAPVIVTVISFVVPSSAVTVTVSVKVAEADNADTVLLLLFNV